MARQNCPYQDPRRRPQQTRSAPLHDGGARTAEPDLIPARTPARTPAQAALAETGMCIHRAAAPIPAQPTAAECESVALLRRQNELLTEILCALNTQLALRLDHSGH